MIPFTEVMYRLLLVRSKSLIFIKFFSVRLSLLRFVSKSLSSLQRIGWPWLVRSPRSIRNLRCSTTKSFQEKPATPTLLFRVHKKSIRKAKFFSCSVMTNLTSLTIGNSIRKSSKNFHLLFLTESILKRVKLFSNAFSLQKYSHWVTNYSPTHPLKSEKILKQTETYLNSFHHPYFLTCKRINSLTLTPYEQRPS